MSFGSPARDSATSKSPPGFSSGRAPSRRTCRTSARSWVSAHESARAGGKSTLGGRGLLWFLGRPGRVDTLVEPAVVFCVEIAEVEHTENDHEHQAPAVDDTQVFHSAACRRPVPH